MLMLSIAEFFGITIYMYYAHGQHKAPYFHARYQGSDASFAIETGQILSGSSFLDKVNVPDVLEERNTSK